MVTTDVPGYGATGAVGVLAEHQTIDANIPQLNAEAGNGATCSR
ncbi:hypothetical protein SAMN02982989_3176 [Xaviernesmea oryzae]|uniref:Uncharacterized protein n=1 Tax=Xaviernesmea oryzae TaxID=464029 RepID=A0A1X7FJG5_9HYPH|nr:hypothetical protein SAMN02982989_3176 [Xaviernesmea oryzae]